MKDLKKLLQIIVLGVAVFLVVYKLLVPKSSTPQTHVPYLKFPKTTIARSTKSTGVVKEVFDGDTILLTTGEVVRYQGIDTPEIAHPPKREECFGDEAKARNKELVMGKQVTLVSDTSNYDRYGRLLRYVYLQDTSVNMQLVREGMALVVIYPPDVSMSAQLKSAEDEARKEKSGLWGKCDLKKRKSF